LFNKVSNSIVKLVIKALLFITNVIVFLIVGIASNLMVKQMIDREKAMMKTYTDIYRHYILSHGSNLENSLFFIETITHSISFPIISTDANDEPLADYESYTLNLPELKKIPTIEKQREYLINRVKSMKANYPPIIVYDENGVILSKLYYSHSQLVDYLRFFPLLSVFTVMAIVAIGYFAFNSAKDSEQSRIWVGMAREAAHQLGTPISSLLAWIELLKLNKNHPDTIEDVSNEIGNDVSRLSIIATRFSKIGSLPDIKSINIADKIDEVCHYYEKRLPHLAGKVTIKREYENPLIINANEMLVGWVFENLLKNAVEAMDGKNGELTILINRLSNKKLQILIKDNGKGMGAKLRLRIFEPGFTTKKRGWGIGLNLVKRIIEEYHNGKIYVKESAPNKGTTFAIELPIIE